MAPRTKPRLVSTALVAEPTTGAEADEFVGAPSPTAPAPMVPASVQAETERAKAAQAEGRAHVYRGEQASRLSVDIPPGLHKALRLRCVADEVTISAFVIRALNAAGVVEP